VCVEGGGSIKNLQDVLRLTVPTKPHQNNELLFELARGVLTLELLEHRTYSFAQILDVFNQWYERSLPFLRQGQTRDDYMTEFMTARKKAKHPLASKADLINEIWNLAQTQPLPPEAKLFENRERQLLVALCYQLQLKNGSEPFHLSSRVCQRLLGHSDHNKASDWLLAFQAMGIIELATKGNARQATRYRYVSMPTKPNE
jgi:hypothetical protein